jgi:hypothetical protein
LGPRRIPTTTGEAHEQELMIFAAVEYDAGASLHAASQPASHVSVHAFICKKGGAASFEFEMNVI